MKSSPTELPQSNTGLSVDAERLLSSLAAMAVLGATPKGGVNRQTLTDLDREARDLFCTWCDEAGLTVRVDEMGNLFARRAGRDDQRDPVQTGSHLDTQPTGGRYDGALGVLAGLEVMRALNDADYVTEAPLELVMWTNEEGCRFAPAMMGSGVHAGLHDRDFMMQVEDPNGRSFGEELQRIGYQGPIPCTHRRNPTGALIELHIEQGPLLEDEGIAIGVVTGGQAQRWYEIELVGMESHAGTTPMPVRRDALVAAAGIVTAVRALGEEFAPHARTTCGVLEARPNSRNVIPGSVFLTVDMRHPDAQVLATMDARLRAAANDSASQERVACTVGQILDVPAVEFHTEVVEAVRSASEDLSYSHRDIISGAGHDAMNVARVAPAGMVFIPCVDGISHNEIENALPDDIVRGANVLLRALVSLADRPGPDAAA
ncbi:MAG: Zn-dependent hydrolase [Rhodospirillales bacterium]|nr:Zn-dependent hydrolase [Rhodospirillales bacterium]